MISPPNEDTFIRPTSSPKITRMLGFVCAATEGADSASIGATSAAVIVRRNMGGAPAE
jgi:hypothetical protein